MTVSTGIYIIRRRLLIGLLEKANANKDMTLSKIFLSDIVRRRRFMVMKCRGIGIILQL